MDISLENNSHILYISIAYTLLYLKIIRICLLDISEISETALPGRKVEKNTKIDHLNPPPRSNSRQNSKKLTILTLSPWL